MEMNEFEIQKRNTVQEQKDNPITETKDITTGDNNREDIDPTLKLDLFNYLNLDLRLIKDADTTQRVFDMVEWAKSQRPDASSADIIEMLNIVAGRIGRNPAIPFSDHLWNYIRLDINRRDIEKKMKNLEKVW